MADLLYARDHGLTAFNILNLVPHPQENIRDRLEDYDDLALLAEAQGYEAAKKYLGRLVKSMTEFARDPAALTAVRDEIADQIEAVR